MNAPSTQRPFPRFALLLVVLLTIAVYARSVVFDFIWDDFSLVLLNPWLTSWAYAPRFFVGHMWSMSSISNIPFHYRPLYQLWMLLLSQTVGTVSTWWHLVSVLLHGIVTWMVFQLTRELTQDDWAALFSALIFGLFPVHVESVAWISASPDLLAGIALLASMLHHIRWMQQGRRPSDRWISLAWFVCAVFVKETTLAFPAVVIVGSMEWGSE